MAAPRSPIIPGNKKDRTGTAGILRRAIAAIRTRFAGLARDAVAIFDRIPVYSVNDSRAQVVRYGLTAQQMATLSEELQAAVQRWLLSGRDPRHAFWWDQFVDEATHLGMTQAAANLAHLSEVYAAARTVETIIYSEPYKARLAAARFKSYEHWTGTAAAQRSELAQIIGRAVADGKNPKAVRAEIMERLEVGKARAIQYAQTDITDSLRQARLAEDQAAEDELGVRTGELWTSAFLPTTRPWHASRSGRVYTREEVRAFYEERGNRYRCHCSLTACLLDADGKPILTKKAQSTLANERRAWQSVHDKG